MADLTVVDREDEPSVLPDGETVDALPGWPDRLRRDDRLEFRAVGPAPGDLVGSAAAGLEVEPAAVGAEGRGVGIAAPFDDRAQPGTIGPDRVDRAGHRRRRHAPRDVARLVLPIPSPDREGDEPGASASDAERDTVRARETMTSTGRPEDAIHVCLRFEEVPCDGMRSHPRLCGRRVACSRPLGHARCPDRDERGPKRER